MKYVTEVLIIICVCTFSSVVNEIRFLLNLLLTAAFSVWYRAQENWTWREEWSNPWSAESSRTAGQTHTVLLFILPSSACPFLSVFIHSFFLNLWSSLLTRSQDVSADRTELTLPAGIEFRDNCKCPCASPLPFTVSVNQSIAGNYWTLVVVVVVFFPVH